MKPRLVYRALCLLLATALLAAPPLPAAAASEERGAPADPRIALDTVSGAVGDPVVVTLSGWPQGNVTVSVCGGGRYPLSADCGHTDAVTIAVDETGSGAGVLTVAQPPVDCPCQVQAVGLDGRYRASADFAVDGVAILTPRELQERADLRNQGRPARAVTATDAHFVREGEEWWHDWPAWFAVPTRRTVRVTLENTGAEPITDPVVSIGVGRGSDPTLIVYPPRVPRLEPGQRADYDIAVDLPPPLFGSYTVRGEVMGLDEPATFTAETTSWPWAFLGAGALLGGFAAMWVVSGVLVRAVRGARWVARRVRRARS